MKLIEIIVSPHGETTIESQGFAGGECLSATRQLEAALGRKSADRLTNEFFQAAHESASQRLTVGGPCN